VKFKIGDWIQNKNSGRFYRVSHKINNALYMIVSDKGVKCEYREDWLETYFQYSKTSNIKTKLDKILRS